MSLLQSTAVFFYLVLFVISLCSYTVPAPTGGTGVTEVAKDNSFYHYIMTALLPRVDINYIEGGKEKGRVKRQAGAGKFTESSKMSPMKVMRVYLQNIKNMFSTAPIGGVHPMSPMVPKPVVHLFKLRIIEFFFPDVGEERVQ